MPPTNRRILDGVPVVTFYRGGPRPPQDDPFPACLQAILEFRGEDLGLGAELGRSDPWHDVHVYLMGASGSAFRVLWDPVGWSPAIYNINAMAPDALQPLREACAAAGYACDISMRRDYAADLGIRQEEDPAPADWRARVVESIDRGMPVIAIGVVGGPEAGLVTGYDDGGEVIIGRTFFDDEQQYAGLEREPDGRYRKRDWFGSTQSLIVLTGPQPRPSDLDTAIRSLTLGLTLLRTPEVRGLKSGQAALTAWAESLQKPAGADDAVEAERKEVHCGNGGTLAESRAWGASYLRILAGRFPGARDDLLAASGCFDDIHDLVWAIWEFTDGRDKGAEEAVRRYRDGGIRGRIVPLLRLARTRDADAARHIERALEALNRQAGRGEGLRPAANPAARVVRRGRGARIDGVPALGWGQGRDCTFLGALEAALSVTEEPWSYVDLVGNSGIAFRTRWSNAKTISGWSHSSACGEFMEEFGDTIRATGRGLDAVFGPVEPGSDALREILASLDAGLPYIGPVAGPDVAVVYGYKRGGATLLAHTYNQPERTEYRPGDLGDWRIFLGSHLDGLSPLAALLRALRTAVRNWDRGTTDAHYRRHGMEWHYGKLALEEWVADLAADSADRPAAERARLADVTRFCYLSLLDARRHAVQYLAARAHLLWGEARTALDRARETYALEVAALEQGAAALAGDDAPVRQDEPGAWAGSGVRDALCAALTRARALEEEAISSLGAALRAHAEAVPADADAEPGERMVLRGVPRIGYGVHLCPFPGSLHAVLEYIGDPRDYDWLMGVTGACFRRFWEKDDGGNVDLMYLEPEPYERAAAALHYDIRRVPRDKGAMIEAVKESIARGRPVLTFGPIGPPEVGIATGYDRGGEVLVGWSYFADASQGYYDQIDWFERQEDGPGGALVLGDRRRWGGDDRRTTLLKSLRWAIDLARVPQRACAPGHLSGLAAYDGWAAGLEVDADYPADDAPTLAVRVMVHGDQCAMLEDRRSAAAYLRQMADAAPEAEAELCAAAGLYGRAADLGSRVWLWDPNMGPETQQGLARPDARRGIAAAVREARNLEAAAVDCLERAVAAMEAGR